MMERPVFNRVQKATLQIVGFIVFGAGMIFTGKPYTVFPGFTLPSWQFWIGALIGGFVVCLGLFSESEDEGVFEPPFGKIWFHEWRIKVGEEDIKLKEKAVAECKLEIERRQSRIAELEREKLGH